VSIGETLTAARIAAGLTTADVAEKTRIRRTLVEAIEADDYRLCGGDIYARGHIATIARTVGTDPVPLLADFDRSHPRDVLRATEVFEAETTKTRERRAGPNWSAAMAAAIVVIVLLAGWQLSRGGGNGPGTTATGQSSTTTRSSSAASPPGPRSSTPPSVSHSPSSKPSSSDLAQVPPIKGVVVKVAAVDGNCWVQAKAGTHVVYEGTLQTHREDVHGQQAGQAHPRQLRCRPAERQRPQPRLTRSSGADQPPHLRSGRPHPGRLTPVRVAGPGCPGA